MAETYAARKRTLIVQARELRKALRKVDTQVEVMQRAVQSLTMRRTLITPDSIVHIGNQLTDLNRLMDSVDNEFARLGQLATSYL